jgi:predicted nucleic acid-binding protein
VIYVDTSIIVKLYVREPLSLETAAWVRENNEALPLTPFHDLEFSNALHLKRFRKEMSDRETAAILRRFRDHELQGVYYRPACDWAEVFQTSLRLSEKHTGKIGCRSLDILHVASALAMGVDRFATLDERQAELAKLAGLKALQPTTPRGRTRRSSR